MLLTREREANANGPFVERTRSTSACYIRSRMKNAMVTIAVAQSSWGLWDSGAPHVSLRWGSANAGAAHGWYALACADQRERNPPAH